MTVSVHICGCSIDQITMYRVWCDRHRLDDHHHDLSTSPRHSGAVKGSEGRITLDRRARPRPTIDIRPCCVNAMVVLICVCTAGADVLETDRVVLMRWWCTGRADAQSEGWVCVVFVVGCGFVVCAGVGVYVAPGLGRH